jgi:hypothetical protein
LGEDVGERAFVLEEGYVDGALGEGVEVAVAVVVGTEGPAAAAGSVAEQVVALAAGGGQAAGVGGFGLLRYAEGVIHWRVSVTEVEKKKRPRAAGIKNPRREGEVSFSILSSEYQVGGVSPPDLLE